MSWRAGERPLFERAQVQSTGGFQGVGGVTHHRGRSTVGGTDCLGVCGDERAPEGNQCSGEPPFDLHTWVQGPDGYVMERQHRRSLQQISCAGHTWVLNALVVCSLLVRCGTSHFTSSEHTDGRGLAEREHDKRVLMD